MLLENEIWKHLSHWHYLNHENLLLSTVNNLNVGVFFTLLLLSDMGIGVKKILYNKDPIINLLLDFIILDHLLNEYFFTSYF